MEILVLTISDRASKGIYEDLSGSALVSILEKEIGNCSIHKMLVADEIEQIIGVFDKYSFCDFIITTGGTGISPRDVTPDATTEWCERIVPGIAEYLRAESMRETKNAVFSRAVAAVKGKTMIVNLPGSVKGATYCLNLLIPLMSHAQRMIVGDGH